MDHNMQKYQAFVTTAECGSFTKAAELLGYSQSSISKMIADLEEEWDLRLLKRSRAGVQLSSDGMAMLLPVRKLLAENRCVQEQALALNNAAEGTIRIGTFSSVATHWMPNIIGAFKKDYPGIRYEMLLGDYSEIEQWIFEGRVDCGFVRLPSRPDFDIIALAQDEMVAVLPADHPLTEKKTLRVKDLEQEPFMLLEHGGRTDVSELLEQARVHPDIRFTTWDDYAILAMIEQGHGVGVLHSLILKRNPYRVAVRHFAQPVYRKIGLAMRDASAASAAVRKFVTYLKFRDNGAAHLQKR